MQLELCSFDLDEILLLKLFLPKLIAMAHPSQALLTNANICGSFQCFLGTISWST